MGDTSFSGGHTAAGAAVGSSTPSTQAHADSAASGSSAEAARVDHKHAMPAAGGGTEAAQSDMEDRGTSNANRFVSPEVAHFGPHAAKAWCHDTTSSGTADSSYNVSSVVSGAVGFQTLNWNTDFSSVNYCCHGGPASSPHKAAWTTKAVGSIIIHVVDSATTNVDDSINTTAWGDQ